MEEQVVCKSTVRLPRGVEVLMKDISLWGKEWYPWISQRWEAIFKYSDNERNSSPQKWRFGRHYLFQIWITFFLLYVQKNVHVALIQLQLFMVTISVKFQKGLNTLMFQIFFCLKKFNLFEFCVMNRPKSKSLFRSKYMRHFALKSNTVQVGCQWHWMFPTAKFHWDQQKVIFNLRAILDRKASSLCCNNFFHCVLLSLKISETYSSQVKYAAGWMSVTLNVTGSRFS